MIVHFSHQALYEKTLRGLLSQLKIKNLRGGRCVRKNFRKYEKIEDVIGEGDKVCLRIVVRGVHTGSYLGVVATGKDIKIYSVVIRRVVKGLVVEEWQVNDQMSLMKSI